MTNTTHTRPDPLIDYLEGIAARQDRATLARLRAGLHIGRELEALPVVLPFLPSEADNRWRLEEDATLVAGLFATHPISATATLPGVLRPMALVRSSVEDRFRALLGTARADLDVHLRHLVGLASAEGAGLDWRDLRRAVRSWDHPDRYIQRQWARTFWGPAYEESQQESHATEGRTPA